MNEEEWQSCLYLLPPPINKTASHNMPPMSIQKVCWNSKHTVHNLFPSPPHPPHRSRSNIKDTASSLLLSSHHALPIIYPKGNSCETMTAVQDKHCINWTQPLLNTSGTNWQFKQWTNQHPYWKLEICSIFNSKFTHTLPPSPLCF